PLPPPAPQRNLHSGEIHAVYECEDFAGMDGNGEDVGVAQGWTWHTSYRSFPYYSRLRAAVNNTGSGAIHTPVAPPLPTGSYKIFLRAASVLSDIRVTLGTESLHVTPLRIGWNEVGTVKTNHPSDRLTVEVLQKIGPSVILDSVYITNDLSTQATTGLDPSRQFLPIDARPAKTRRTIWTAEYLRGVRRRISEHEALAKEEEEIIAKARRLAHYSDEQLWNLLADMSIKRTYYVNQNKGCPKCGLKIKEFDNFHPWILEPIKRPFKMVCPSCKQIFPTNDFASGQMSGGEYADDGAGCKVGDDVYHFLGEYVHFSYRSHFLPHLQNLTQATVLSGDPELAHKAAVMLLRAAQQYPNSEDRLSRGFASQGQPWGFRSGCITDSIWSSYEGRDYGQAYDAVWPFIQKDQALLALARREIPGIETEQDLRLYIEENLLRRIGQAYCDGAIIGNVGYHHKGMAWLLLALGDMESNRFPDCRDLVEFLYYRVFGNTRTLCNLLGRDGSSFESPGYNSSRLNLVATLPLLDRFFEQEQGRISRDRYPDLWDDPRFRAQFDYYTDYIMLDRWFPAVGDAGGKTIVPERTPPAKLSVVSEERALKAWERYRTPKLAMIACGIDNQPPPPSLWEERPLKELAAARAKAPRKLERKTNLQDDYGLVFLRSGAGENARVLWAWYGHLLSHRHDDRLVFGLVGKGMDLLPDLGYPKSWAHAGRWESHSLTHNTVTVDGAAFPRGRHHGRVTLLGAIPGFQVVELEAGSLPSDGQVARRLMALVDIDESQYYVVDMFDVRAGEKHILSYHGPQATVQASGVDLTAQPRGTIAGEGIEYGKPEVGTDGKQTFSPLSHMTDVERGNPTTQFTLDYALGDDQDTRVRLRHFPDSDTALALGTGRPPSHPDAYKLRYCMQTRTGAKPLASRFLTVVEPYSKRQSIQSVKRSGQAGFGKVDAIRLVHDEGTDILLFGPTAQASAQIDGAELVGRAGFVRYRDDTPVLLAGYGFTSLRAEGVRVAANTPFLRGEIVSCGYRDQRVVVTGVPADKSLIGFPVRIHNQRRSTLPIIKAVAKRKDGIELTLTTSALRHEGWVSAIANGSIRNGAPSPWAFQTFLAGTRLVSESETSSWRVISASGGWWSAPTGTAVWLETIDGKRASAQRLGEGLTDADGDGSIAFRIYEYGVGDKIEIASFAKLKRTGGKWGGTLSPGCRLIVE
ncbi:MAG: heparinase II/III family protein, partial [Lentisphaeria bacterium]|nr:heparinase II/III family protein [Lentisphaeria bacterium]